MATQSDSIDWVWFHRDCWLQSPIATLTGVEGRDSKAASLYQDLALFITARMNTSKTKLKQYYIHKNTKLGRRRGRRKIIKSNIGWYITRAAKALIINKPIVIFYTRYKKSSLVQPGAVSVTNIFTVEISGVL